MSDLSEEISLLTKSIKELIASGIPSNKIAILLRSVRSSGREIYDALFQEGVPVECPTFSDAEEFIVEFCIPLFEWLEISKEPQNEEEEVVLINKSEELFNQVIRWSSKKDLEEDIFWTAVEKWKVQLKENTSESYNIRSNLYELLNTIEIKVDQDSDDLMVGLGIASQIIRSVEEIHRRRLVEQNRKKSISLIKETRIALRENFADFGESIPLEIQGNGVLITTVHQSKGLEWPVVFIPRLSGRRFPLNNSKHKSSFNEAITVRYGTTVEDEKRLFYVACTRAEEKLIVMDESNTQPNSRSQFIKDFVEAKGSTPSTIPPIANDLIYGIEFKESGQDGTQRIGLSDVLVYLECPFQYGLKNRIGIQQPIEDTLGYGKGLHEIIQRRFDDNKDWDAKEIETNVKKNVSLPYTSQTQEQISQGAIGKMLAGLQSLGIFKSKVKSEESVEVYFPEGIVEGVIDNIEILSDGV